MTGQHTKHTIKERTKHSHTITKQTIIDRTTLSQLSITTPLSQLSNTRQHTYNYQGQDITHTQLPAINQGQDKTLSQLPPTDYHEQDNTLSQLTTKNPGQDNKLSQFSTRLCMIYCRPSKCHLHPFQWWCKIFRTGVNFCSEHAVFCLKLSVLSHFCLLFV